MISNDRVLGVNLPGIQLGHHISMPFPRNLTTCFVVQMENSALGRLSVAFDSPFKARNLEDLEETSAFPSFSMRSMESFLVPQELMKELDI